MEFKKPPAIPKKGAGKIALTGYVDKVNDAVTALYNLPNHGGIGDPTESYAISSPAYITSNRTRAGQYNINVGTWQTGSPTGAFDLNWVADFTNSVMRGVLHNLGELAGAHLLIAGYPLVAMPTGMHLADEADDTILLPVFVPILKASPCTPVKIVSASADAGLYSAQCGTWLAPTWASAGHGSKNATFEDVETSACNVLNMPELGHAVTSAPVLQVGETYESWPMFVGGTVYFVTHYERSIKGIRISADGTSIQHTIDPAEPPADASWIDDIPVAQCTGVSLSEFNSY